MNFLKVFLVILTWNIGLSTTENSTTVVRGSINPWKNDQKYCGELLERSIEIVCVEMQRRRPRDTVINATVRRKQKIQFLQEKCCDEQCSLEFIKANCPGTRKNGRRKNSEVVTSTTAGTTSSLSTTITKNISTITTTQEPVDYQFFWGAPPAW